MAEFTSLLADDSPDLLRTQREDQLVDWIMARVNRWRRYRDMSFEKTWGEDYRLWRGRWTENDRTRKSERSKMVMPALAQALEMTVSELEEAAFGREMWIDTDDTQPVDPQKQEVTPKMLAGQLADDLHKAKVEQDIADSFLLGGLQGQCSLKIIVEKDPTVQVARDEMGNLETSPSDHVRVRVESIPADELVVDPSATSCETALGVAHEVVRPLHWIKAQQKEGIFHNVPVARQDADGLLKDIRGDLEGHVRDEDAALVTEYHGKVPRRFLEEPEALAEESTDDILSRIMARDETSATDDMVEAIVTIANKRVLLRAIENPFLNGDRSIISCQFERVPGRFFGRSLMEKGRNPQRALDAEVRARMDALALTSHPMVAADATALPHNFDFTVQPGKVWLTNGAPRDILMPFQFQGLDPSTFNQSSEMERMVQVGTGAMDTATPLKENRRNETAGGMAMQTSAFIKRAKRAMRNITGNLMEPLVRKVMWRYMQFDPQRYPAEFRFRVITGMGHVAREYETMQLIQLMSMTPPESPIQLQLLKAVVDNTSTPQRNELVATIDQMLQPDPEQQQIQQQMQQLSMAQLEAEVMKTQAEAERAASDSQVKQAEVMYKLAQIQTEMSKPGVEHARLKLEAERLLKDLEGLREQSRQNTAAMIRAQAAMIQAQSNRNRGDSDGD
jgi:hypothetical protein